jgi:hypothetical protein
MELGVPQVVFVRPFQELNLRDQHRLQTRTWSKVFGDGAYQIVATPPLAPLPRQRRIRCPLQRCTNSADCISGNGTLKSTISGPFFIGNLVGVGCQVMLFGPRLGTLLATLPEDANMCFMATPLPPLTTPVSGFDAPGVR